MKKTGFYKLTPELFGLIKRLGGIYRDRKDRPVYCCIQDNKHSGVYWAIPMSDVSHRTPEQLDRVRRFCTLPDRDIRSCYYHLGHTNRPAIFRISNVLPVTEKYIAGEYTSQGTHLVLMNERLIAEIERKLSRILFDESRHPNKYEQHITSVYTFLAGETTEAAAKDKPSVIAEIRADEAEPREDSSTTKFRRKNEPEL